MIFLAVLLTSKYGDRCQSVSESVRSNWEVVQKGMGCSPHPHLGKELGELITVRLIPASLHEIQPVELLTHTSRYEGTCMLALATRE